MYLMPFSNGELILDKPSESLFYCQVITPNNKILFWEIEYTSKDTKERVLRNVLATPFTFLEQDFDEDDRIMFIGRRSSPQPSEPQSV